MISLRSKKSQSFSWRTAGGSTSIRFFIVLTAIILVGAGIGVKYELLRQSDQVGRLTRAQNSESAIESAKPFAAVPGLGMAEINAWLATGASSWPVDELAQAILALDDSVRENVLAKLTDNFRSNPTLWSGFVEKLATMWAEQSPGPAILFLGSLSNQPDNDRPEIIQLESKLMSKWVGNDFPGVGSYFQQAWKQQGSIPSAQLDLWVTIVQNEQKAKFGDMLSWVDGLQGEENRPLKIAVSEALVRMGQSGNFQQIADLLGKDLTDARSASCASQFAARNAVAHPKEVVQWLEKLAPNVGPWGSIFINDFFDQLGRSDPRTAVKLINSGFTDQFVDNSPASMKETPGAPPPAVARQLYDEQLYDQALSHLVSGIIVQNPEYALTCSGYFYNPGLQAQYTKMVQHLMLSSARQNHE